MSEPALRAATYRDLFDLPENVVGEILAGEIYATPRPIVAHGVVSSNLGMDLGVPFGRGRGGPGGWWILDEPEVHLGGDVLVPDLAGWRRERLPDLLELVHIDIAPDWVCEILSPATQVRDRTLKMSIYAREGVPHLWLVDPKARLLEVYRLHEGRWLLLGVHEGRARVRAEPFDAVELALGPLWGEVEEAAKEEG
jgi:Uma2 family endonuclease